MEKQIRRVGAVLTIAFLAVFGMLNWVQFFDAKSIAGNPANRRATIAEYSIKRGDITTLDGITIARSRETDGTLKYAREYPEGDLYGHITGFYSFIYGTAGIEAAYNDELLGDTGVVSVQDIGDKLFGSGEQGDDVKLTIHSELQQLAREQLGAQEGAVVALDPQSGEVRAMWSNPSYDPNPLASFDPGEAKKYRNTLDPNSPTSPLVRKATSRSFPPGSTFKVVTTAAALESGRYTPQSTFRDPVELDLPLTDDTLTNFSKSACFDGVQIDLFRALVISCDTTYAILGLEIPDELRSTAEEFGFNEPIPFDLSTDVSTFPEIPDDEEPQRAFAGIGQGNVAATPLQMALVAAAVGNGGDVPRPRLVREITDPSGGIVEKTSPETIGEAMSSETAEEVKKMMVQVVEDPSGTGTAAQIEGVDVAGKTGTAQNVEGEAPHAWFIAFAPAENPQIAVSVLVEKGGTLGSEATGGQIAAPIAKAIIERDRELRGW
ncbi:MAG: penicillin-binding transpeptidase domain-containing protein [Actinomycetota bacterium]|nr:penicillin-binding transpeptidase domain-containing protein [Actinomycetota bacterium]